MNGHTDGALESRVRDVAVTETVSDTPHESDLRRVSGIETVSTGVDGADFGLTTVVKIGPTAERLGSGSQFSGLLGLSLARYDSPVRLTFRDHSFSVDATEPDTPFDDPEAGSLHTATSPVAPQMSGLPVDRGKTVSADTNLDLIASGTQSTSSTNRHFSRQHPRTVARLHQPMSRPQRTDNTALHRSPLTATGGDGGHQATSSTESTSTQSTVSRSRVRRSDTQHTATDTDRIGPLSTRTAATQSTSTPSANHNPRTTVSLDASGRRSVVDHADSMAAGHSYVPQRLVQPRRPVAELQSHSISRDHSTRPVVSPLESVDMASGRSAVTLSVRASRNSSESSWSASLSDHRRRPTAEAVWQHTPTPASSVRESSGQPSSGHPRSVDSYQSSSSRRQPPAQRVSTATSPVVNVSSQGSSTGETQSRRARGRRLSWSTVSTQHSPHECDTATAGTGRTHQQRDRYHDPKPAATRMRRQQSQQPPKPVVDPFVPAGLGQPQTVDRFRAVDRPKRATTRRVPPRSVDSTATQPDSTHRSRATQRQRLTAVDPTGRSTSSPMGSGMLISTTVSAWTLRSRPDSMDMSVKRATNSRKKQETKPTATAYRDYSDCPSDATPQSERLISSGRLTSSDGLQSRSHRQDLSTNGTVMRPLVGANDSVASTLPLFEPTPFDPTITAPGLDREPDTHNGHAFRTSTGARRHLTSVRSRRHLAHESSNTLTQQFRVTRSVRQTAYSNEALQLTQLATAASHQGGYQLLSTASGGSTTSGSTIRQQTKRHEPTHQRQSTTAPASADPTAVTEASVASRRRSIIAHRLPLFHSPTPSQSESRSRTVLASESMRSVSLTVRTASLPSVRTGPMRRSDPDRRSTVPQIDLEYASETHVPTVNSSHLRTGARTPQSTDSVGRTASTEQHSRQDRQQSLASSRNSSETRQQPISSGHSVATPPVAQLSMAAGDGHQQSAANTASLWTGSARQSTAETAAVRTYSVRQSASVDLGTPIATAADRGSNPRNDGRSTSHLVSNHQQRRNRARLSTLSSSATGRRSVVGLPSGPIPATQRRQITVSRLATASAASRPAVGDHSSTLSQSTSESTHARTLSRPVDGRQQPVGEAGRTVETTDWSQSTPGRRIFVSDSTQLSTSAHARPDSPRTNMAARPIRPTATSTQRRSGTAPRSVDDFGVAQSHPSAQSVAARTLPIRTVISDLSRSRYTTDHTIQRRPRQSSTEQEIGGSGSVGANSIGASTLSRTSGHRLDTDQSTPVATDPELASLRTSSTAPTSEGWSWRVDTSAANGKQSERFPRLNRTQRRGEAAPSVDSLRADSSQVQPANQSSRLRRRRQQQSTERRSLRRLGSPAASATRRSEQIGSRDRVTDIGRLRERSYSVTLSTATHPDTGLSNRQRRSQPIAAIGAATVETHSGETQLESTAGPRYHQRSSVGAASVSGTVDSVHEQFVDREQIASSYDATVLSVAAMDGPQPVAEQSNDGRRPAVGTSTATSGGVDWLAYSGQNAHESGSETASRSGKLESGTAVDSKAPNMTSSRSGTVERAAEAGTADRPQMTFKQSATQAAHDGDGNAGATGGRVDPNRQRRKRSTTAGERSTAAGRSAVGRAEPQSASDRRGHATADSDPFEPVDRPTNHLESNTDRTPNRRHHRREDTDRQSDRRGLDGSLGAESLAYDADVDRVVETLYRRLERKLRIERERTGF